LRVLSLIAFLLVLGAPPSLAQSNGYFFRDYSGDDAEHFWGCGTTQKQTPDSEWLTDCPAAYAAYVGDNKCTTADGSSQFSYDCGSFVVRIEGNLWNLYVTTEPVVTLRYIGGIRYQCPDGQRYGPYDIWKCGSYPRQPKLAGVPPSAGQAANQDCRTCADPGNPINPLTGNKYQVETDYVGSGPYPLQFQRFYNSTMGFGSGLIGTKWRHTFDRSLVVLGSTVTVVRPDGKQYVFTDNGTTWVAPADVMDRLTPITGGWTYRTAPGDELETYNSSGRLLSIANRAGVTQTLAYNSTGQLASVTHSLTGRTLSFSYDASRRISTMTDEAAQVTTYAYDASANLVSVTYPSATSPAPVRTYVYNESAHTSGTSLPNHLTGIVDENAQRYSTYKYGSDGRALSTELAGTVRKYSVAYGTGFSTVTDPLNTSRDFSYQTLIGVPKHTGIGTTQSPCDGCGVGETRAYDTNGYLSSDTNYNGVISTYVHDARGLETSRTEASGTPQAKTITTAWHADYRLPTQIAEPLRMTTNVYGSPTDTNPGNRGSLLSRTVQATTDANGSQGLGATVTGTARTWTYTYDANGQVLTVDGPRTDVSDVTTYTYYSNTDTDLGKRGNVATVTNAAGHVTQITAYNAHGQPLTIVDPNGLTTTLTYDARLRLKTRTVGSEVTSYDYDGVGQLTKVTLPDGSYLTYTYDAAHRLTALQDNLGNRIAYTLDAMGNRTLEQVYDPANTLAQTRSRVYSSLNRLFQELGATSQTTEYGYDDQGNVTSVKDPLNRTTTNQYDALNRLKQVTDPGTGVTQYGYNGLDALTSVTDPRSLVTGYTVDGLGNLTQQASPDTGNTVNTYDAAGNLLTQTDAKSQVTSYTYDALNRVTLITFHDGSKQAYAYDQGTNGLGRLSSITETNPSNAVTSLIQYAYDVHGRVTSETRTVNAVAHATGYSYDSAGRLSGLTYPSGRTVTYTFDALGRVSQLSTTKGGQSQVVVQNVAYHPFGGVKSFTLGNGQIYSRSIDLDGRIASYTLGGTSYALTFDAASRITGIGANTYGYDSLDRLTSAVLPSSNFGYSYDAVGNRLTKTTGAATDTYAYSSTSNRIATITPPSGPVKSFVFDANGSTTNDALNTYGYDTRGRMVQATSSVGTTTYQVNALGQRIRKTNSLGDTVFHYDAQGRLIAETDASGTLKRELLYLGDIPVGVVQ
jgi:YD repeat-containing protein